MFLALPGILGTGILDPINVGGGVDALHSRCWSGPSPTGWRRCRSDTLDSASAMGYTGRQRLFAVQLPLAVPAIGAGLRVAAVSNVSLVAVASTLGVQPTRARCSPTGNQQRRHDPDLARPDPASSAGAGHRRA